MRQAIGRSGRLWAVMLGGLLAGALLFGVASAAQTQSDSSSEPVAVLPVPPDAPPAVVEGIWLTAAKSQMTIQACDVGYCGYITKIVVPDDVKAKYGSDLAAIGNNFTDQANKDPNLRTRPILGLQILALTRTKKSPRYWDGQIYNPQDGNTYSGYIEVLDPNTIRLNGCILYNTICKGEDWTREPTPDPAAGDNSSQSQ